MPDHKTIGHWQTRVAKDEDAGERLDKWLAGWTQISRSRMRPLIENGYVRADGNIVTSVTTKVKPTIEYAVQVPPPIDDTPRAEDIPLNIFYEDNEIIVIHKAAGMTVHPAPGSRSATLVNALLYHCANSLSGIGGVMRPGIVHRIDKDTSGLLVVAKNDLAHQYLSKQFSKHTVERRYICFVRSVPKPRDGQFKSRLARSQNDRKKQAVVRGTVGNMEVSDHGRHAITNYKFLTGFGQMPGMAVGTPRVSEIECRLETGRTHQIRVHMAHMGCPLLGDPLYGKQRAFNTAKSAEEIAVRDAITAFKRQALHAATLGFKHPKTREMMRFECPLPPDMAQLRIVLKTLNPS